MGSLPAFRRPHGTAIAARLHEDRRYIQVLAGPRQTGKTTLIRQVLDELELPSHYASADSPSTPDRGWLAAQWDIGRLRATGGPAGAVLVLDEAQKIQAWSDTVKGLWDEDTAAGRPLRVVLLGSAPLLVKRGLTESLAGRFELIRNPHWSFPEMRDAFGWELGQYIFFGGYPGTVPLVDDHARWVSYVLDSLVETTVARDLRYLLTLDHVTYELERIGDYCAGIAKIVLLHEDRPLLKPLVDVPRMAQVCREMLREAVDAFITRDAEKARAVGMRDDTVDRLYDQVYRELLTFMLNDPRTIDRATWLIWVAHNLERIADRVTNICERVVYMEQGKYEELNVSKY